MKGGVAIAGQTGSTYTSSTLTNGDNITVAMTSSLTCATGSPATSNSINMAVNPVLPASVSIAACTSRSDMCRYISYLHSNSCQRGTPTYQWMNGATPIPGATGATYTSTALTNGRCYNGRYDIHSLAMCDRQPCNIEYINDGS